MEILSISLCSRSLANPGRLMSCTCGSICVLQDVLAGLAQPWNSAALHYLPQAPYPSLTLTDPLFSIVEATLQYSVSRGRYCAQPKQTMFTTCVTAVTEYIGSTSASRFAGPSGGATPDAGHERFGRSSGKPVARLTSPTRTVKLVADLPFTSQSRRLE